MWVRTQSLRTPYHPAILLRRCRCASCHTSVVCLRTRSISTPRRADDRKETRARRLARVLLPRANSIAHSLSGEWQVLPSSIGRPRWPPSSRLPRIGVAFSRELRETTLLDDFTSLLQWRLRPAARGFDSQRQDRRQGSNTRPCWPQGVTRTGDNQSRDVAALSRSFVPVQRSLQVVSTNMRERHPALNGPKKGLPHMLEA